MRYLKGYKKEAALSNHPSYRVNIPTHTTSKTKVGKFNGRAMTPEKIIEIVCDVCGITPGDLKKRSRKEPIPTARALIAHFLYRELNMMPRDISPLIGHPNYSRVSANYYLPSRWNGSHTYIEARSPYQRDLREKYEKIQEILIAERH